MNEQIKAASVDSPEFRELIRIIFGDVVEEGHQALIAHINAWSEERCNEVINQLAAPRAMLPVTDELAQIYDLFGIGAEARSIGVLMENIRNTKKFAELLHAVEREFFMVPSEPDEDFPDDEPGEECLLNCWGSTVEQYVEQFGAALASRVASPVAGWVPDGWQLVPKEPTAAMNQAGEYAASMEWALRKSFRWVGKNAYRKMLEAAPPAPVATPTQQEQS